MNRAYSIFEIKEFDDKKRTFSGIATTPSVDRMDDVVEPDGAEFTLPIPFLWQHDSDNPVGHVTKAKVTKKGIEVEVQLQKTDEPGIVKDRLDAAWQYIKLRLVRGLSIGFKAIETARIEGTYGVRFIKWSWLELSGVTIAANQDASILAIKSIDAELRATTRKEMDSMPMPASDETQQRFMARCVDHMLNCGDDLTQAEASAHCAIRWDMRASMSEQMSASVSGRKGTTEAEVRAASGRKRNGNERTVKAGVTASRSTIVVKATEAKQIMKKTIAEQIAAYEATRQAKSARMTEIMDASGETGSTLDESQSQEYDGLKAELKAVDDHLVRLREHEKTNIATAVEVKGSNSEAASQSRSGVRVEVLKRELPKGTSFTRFVLALARAKGNIMMAAEMAKANEQWKAETPDVEIVLRAAVAAGTTSDTTWAAPLVQYQNMTGEFIEYLRPLTIIGRIPGLRMVPFKVKIPRQTGAASVNWVGEGKVKPISALAFDSVTLDFAKIAGIVVLTDELVRHSSPSAEALVREDLAKGIIQFMDSQFVDPTKAADDVSPASITNGVTPVVATGTTAAALRTDLATLFASFLDSNLSVTDGVLIMTQQTSMRIGLMRNSLGQKEFPDINMLGGTLEGLTVVASEGVPATGGSPTDGFPIILAKAGDILVADDGNVTIDASREASLQMDSAPDSPATASTNLISMFQHNMMAIRAEREINWKKRRPDAVGYISNAKYSA